MFRLLFVSHREKTKYTVHTTNDELVNLPLSLYNPQPHAIILSIRFDLIRFPFIPSIKHLSSDDALQLILIVVSVCYFEKFHPHELKYSREKMTYIILCE